MAIEMLAGETNDSGFIGMLNSILSGLIANHAPKQFWVIQIDNWFDHKWMRFSGMGGVSSCKERKTQKYVAHGPVASISTTTRNRLQIDDENRHISIHINESEEQTKQIVKASARSAARLSRHERHIWRMVHKLLEKRIGVEISLPEWFDEVAKRIPADDLRVRRYYPAFLEACRTVCLIRSFQKGPK